MPQLVATAKTTKTLRVLYEELKCATISKWETTIAVWQRQEKYVLSFSVHSKYSLEICGTLFRMSVEYRERIR